MVNQLIVLSKITNVVAHRRLPRQRRPLPRPQYPRGQGPFLQKRHHPRPPARAVLIAAASEECLRDTVAEYLERFPNPDPVEFAIIEELAALYWRLRRAWAIEKQWMDQLIQAQPADIPGISCIANAFAILADTNKFRLLEHYEGRIHRAYHSALETLLWLQKTKNAETNLIPNSNAIQSKPRRHPSHRQPATARRTPPSPSALCRLHRVLT